MKMIEECGRERLYSIILKNSNIPEEFLGLKLNEENRAICDSLGYGMKQIREGNDIYLYSSLAGTGKTTIATFYLQKYLEHCSIYGYNSDDDTPGYFINIRDYINIKKASFNDFSLQKEVADMENKMLNATLAVFDEIGSYGLTEYDTNLIYRFLNHRFSNNKATIFTSGVDPIKLSELIGFSLYRRIIQKAKVVEVQ